VIRSRILYIMMLTVASVGATDPGGWSKARWGMTEPQLVRAFGPEIIRLNPPESIGTTAEDARRFNKTDQRLAEFSAKLGHPLPPHEPAVANAIAVRLAVPLELAGAHCRALLVPDTHGRLDLVLIRPIKNGDATMSWFRSLEQLLVQKYGRPWVTREADSIEDQWSRATTVITLVYYHAPLTNADSVTINYKQKSVPTL
jgi:hypothetical protein